MTAFDDYLAESRNRLAHVVEIDELRAKLAKRRAAAFSVGVPPRPEDGPGDYPPPPKEAA